MNGFRRVGGQLNGFGSAARLLAWRGRLTTREDVSGDTRIRAKISAHAVCRHDPQDSELAFSLRTYWRRLVRSVVRTE